MALWNTTAGLTTETRLLGDPREGSEYNVDNLDKDMSHVPMGRRGQLETSSYHTEQCAAYYLWIIYSWNFPFNIFQLMLTLGNENFRSYNFRRGGTAANKPIFPHH